MGLEKAIVDKEPSFSNVTLVSRKFANLDGAVYLKLMFVLI